MIQIGELCREGAREVGISAEGQELATRAAPMFLECISINGYQTARLLEHDFGDGG